MITRQHLDDFFSVLEAKLNIHKDASRQIASFNAPDFTPFDYFRLDENVLSNVLAGLLDTDGAHGQYDLFLKKFLAILRIDSPKTRRRCKVRTQAFVYAASMHGYLDILIDFGDFGIGIENKPWAMEQTKQVERYCDWLDREYRGEFLFVYVSAEGKPPSSIPEEYRKRLAAEKKFIDLSYDKLRHWLDDCTRTCEADKVRWFLRDLVQYLAKTFPVEDVPHEV